MCLIGFGLPFGRLIVFGKTLTKHAVGPPLPTSSPPKDWGQGGGWGRVGSEPTCKIDIDQEGVQSLVFITDRAKTGFSRKHK